MKVVQINAVCGYGSTGKIAVFISRLLNINNIENYIFYVGKQSDYENGINFSDKKHLKIQALKSRILGNCGFNSKKITKLMISKLESIKPDIIHLHNLHSHNVNLEMLFLYLKNTNVKIVWTFHDCWAFTGYCTHFDFIKCDKWKTECKKCLQYKSYSWFFDKSKTLFNRKKLLFKSLENLTIVTPSRWLESVVYKSFLGDYPVKVINNGIDLETFKPTESDFREKYGLLGKTVILGVAMGFGERKGFKYFLELSKMIDDNMRIVLVGVSKEQTENLPKNIIGIEKTNNQKELAGIYTASDVFLNCTLEETFPTVNIEAISCGTPVVTFNTGGSPEIVSDGCGAVVEKGDIKGAYEKIKDIIKNPDIRSHCIKTAISKYNSMDKFHEYIKLYEKL